MLRPSQPVKDAIMQSQTASICFIDTETTSLRPDRRAWEIAAIIRRPGQADEVRTWFVDSADLELGNADLASLNIGRFYERHPHFSDKAAPGACGREHDVLRELETLTRGVHLVGAMPSFDAEVLAARMRANGLCPPWYYYLQDFVTMIAGYLAGQGKPVPPLPWRSDDLSRLIGVEPPGDQDRHTALGDATWAARVWDAVFDVAAP